MESFLIDGGFDMLASTREQIRRKLIEYLYKSAYAHHKETLNQLVIENNLLLGKPGQGGGFKYKGSPFYYADGYLTMVWKPVLDLDSSLEEKAATCINEWATIDEERKVIYRFLAVILTKCDHVSDVKRLFGDSIFALVQEYSRLDYKPPKDDSEIEALYQEYKEYFDIIKQRYLENIVTRNLYES